MPNQRSRVSSSTPHSYDVERICEALGGYIATASLLGATGWTVKKWMLMVGVNYLDRSATTILAGGSGE